MPWRAALALALAAAVSLGTGRFSYALLLPPMRSELGWSYLLAGTMNTVNAAGYLLGALLLKRVLERFDARAVMLCGGAVAAAALALHGAVRGDGALLVLRALCGIGSAASFVAGGLLAARLAAGADGGRRAGQVLGVYYGGTGVGIVASALLVPPLVQPASGWPWAWLALGVVSALATLLTALGTRALHAPPQPGAPRVAVRWRSFGFGLAGYTMFGLGYIGYMTFIVTLLREKGLDEATITAFYALLGLGVMASSFLWAGLLQRHRGGRPMALLNGLLALATVLPVLSSHAVIVFASGLLFGSVFLSVVASTTALVRHNAAPPAWPAGIAAFTVVFAAGQIVGPSLTGLIADGPGGLLRGLAWSAAALALGSVLAALQRALPLPSRDGAPVKPPSRP